MSPRINAINMQLKYDTQGERVFKYLQEALEKTKKTLENYCDKYNLKNYQEWELKPPRINDSFKNYNSEDRISTSSFNIKKTYESSVESDENVRRRIKELVQTTTIVSSNYIDLLDEYSDFFQIYTTGRIRKEFYKEWEALKKRINSVEKGSVEYYFLLEEYKKILLEVDKKHPGTIIDRNLDTIYYTLYLNPTNFSIRTIIYYQERVKEETGKNVRLETLGSFLLNHEITHKVDEEIAKIGISLDEGFADYTALILTEMSEEERETIKEWREKEAIRWANTSETLEKECYEDVRKAIINGESEELINYLTQKWGYIRVRMRDPDSGIKYYTERIEVEKLVRERTNTHLYDKNNLEIVLELMREQAL